MTGELNHGISSTPGRSDRSEPVVLELAKRLIATPSPNLPGDERAVAEVVAEALRARGLPEPLVLAKEPHRPNLLATMDFGPGGRHLCLCGHLDTKPVGAARWRTDPFEPTVQDSVLYGLGACDMKGAVAAMIEAAAALARSDQDRGRLSLLFTADEENGALYGARYLAESGAVETDAVLIGEPGGIDRPWDRIHLGSRGIANFVVAVHGDQGHSSLSDRRPYVSATLQLARLLTAFAEGFQPSAPAHPLADGPTVNAGVRISGGVGYGVVPGAAEFAVDVRTTPGMTMQAFQADLEGFLAARRAADARLRAEVHFEPAPRDWLPATVVDPAHPLAGAVRQAMGVTLGAVPPDGLFPGATDAAWLQGLAGIPTLPACGPGLLERAHREDESVSVRELEEAVLIYQRTATAFCGAA
jgi:succinyl-diaminopimelate desuccinylase